MTKAHFAAQHRFSNALCRKRKAPFIFAQFTLMNWINQHITFIETTVMTIQQIRQIIENVNGQTLQQKYVPALLEWQPVVSNLCCSRRFIYPGNDFMLSVAKQLESSTIEEVAMN